jgi:hypothetical protein
MSRAQNVVLSVEKNLFAENICKNMSKLSDSDNPFCVQNNIFFFIFSDMWL